MNDTLNENREGLDFEAGKFFVGKLVTSLLHKWWLILLCGVLGAVATFGITYNFITPLYRTGVTIYVNNSKADHEVDYITSSNLSAAERLVSTYVNIIKSDTVLTEVAVAGNLSYSPAEIRGMLTATKSGETEIFTVSVTHEDPETAAQIANTIADVAPAKIEEFVEGSSTKIIDYAKVPTAKYSPNYEGNTVAGAGIGIIIAVAYIALRCLLDVRVRTAEELNVIFDLPVLGQVPVFGSYSSKSKKYGYESEDKASDKKNEVKK